MNWQVESIIFRAKKDLFLDKVKDLIRVYLLSREREKISKALRIETLILDWQIALSKRRYTDAKKSVDLNQKPILRD